jgi:hypothetical protein
MTAATSAQNHSKTIRPNRWLAPRKSTVVAQARHQATAPKRKMQQDLGCKEKGHITAA